MDLQKAEELALTDSDFFCIADRYKQLESPDRAIAALDRAEELNPNNHYIYSNRGEILFGQGRLQDSLNDYNKAIMLAPEWSYTYKRRASVYYQLHQYENAIADTGKALQLRPDDASALLWSGQGRYPYPYHEKIEQLSREVVQRFSQFIENGSEHHWYGRGVANIHLGQWQEAANDFSKAIELEPDRPLLWSLRASAYHRLGRLEDAIADASQSLSLNPRDAAVWHNRGHFHEYLGQLDKAIGDFSKSVELEPHLAKNWNCRGNASMKIGAASDAARDFEKAVTLDPDNAYFRYRSAIVYLQLEKMEAYQRVCADMLTHFAQTDNPEHAHWVAWTSAITPAADVDLDACVELAEMAVEKAPDYDFFVTILGAALYRAERFEEAVQRLEKLAISWGDEPNSTTLSAAYTWFFLAMALNRQGQYDEATRWYDKAANWTDRVLNKEQGKAGVSISWNRRLTLRLLRDEAHSLLGTSAQSESVDSREKN